VFKWIKENWPTLLAIITGPFGLAVLAVTKFRDQILGVFSKIKSIAGTIFDGLATGFKGAINAVLAGIEGGLNFAISGLNKALDGIDKAAGPWVNFGEIPNVKLPRLGDGGIVTGPTVAMIGERGPEAVIPLNRSGMMGANITVNMPAGTNGDELVLALQRWVRSNGALPLATTTSIRR
jgi:hypothetical protein